MQRSLLLALGLIAGAHTAAAAQAPLDFSQLIDRRGVYLHRQTLEPYSGPVVAMWDSTRVRERGTLLNGRWDGVRETFFYEGQLELRETWRNGQLNGPFEGWFREGMPSDKGTYVNGLLEGPYESRWSRAMVNNILSHSGGGTSVRGGELAEQGNYAAGVPCGEWYRWVPIDGGGMRAEEPITYPPCPAPRR
jgi:antitoxin component YwqK of YwqJK toxin-antitoxin module